jgi:hypothetical protein
VELVPGVEQRGPGISVGRDPVGVDPVLELVAQLGDAGDAEQRGVALERVDPALELGISAGASRKSWLVSWMNPTNPARSRYAVSTTATSSRWAASARCRAISSVTSDTTIRTAAIGTPVGWYSTRSWRPARAMRCGSWPSTTSVGISSECRLSNPSWIHAARLGSPPASTSQIATSLLGAPNHWVNAREQSARIVPSRSTIARPCPTLSSSTAMLRLCWSSSVVRSTMICSTMVSCAMRASSSARAASAAV